MAYSGDIVGLDCELVEAVNSLGKASGKFNINIPARVSVIDFSYNTLYDTYVQPPEYANIVTDRSLSNREVRASDLELGEELSVVQEEVKKFIQGKIVVGTDVQRSLTALGVEHPAGDIRDIREYFEYKHPDASTSLKDLAWRELHVTHPDLDSNSLDDVRLVMRLYRMNQNQMHEFAIEQEQE